MLEELLTNTTLSPALIATGLGVAVVCFLAGWLGRTKGANKTEAELKREILEAKRSIPQLESSVRNRDLQIGRLEEDLKELNERSNDLTREKDEKERELKGASREVKNLTSEIEAIRGKSRANENVIMDGFEDEAPADASANSAIEVQLRKTEALYEKLKGALIDRDGRIEALQAELANGGQSVVQETPAPALDNDAAEDVRQELEGRIRSQDSIIADLQQQAAELRKEKEMLEDLASRRSKSNRALKEASVEAENKLPQLEVAIAAHEQTIKDREASIKRLLDDLDSTRKELTATRTDIERSQTQLAAKAAELETSGQRVAELQSSLSLREDRIAALDADLTNTERLVAQRESELATLRETLTSQEAAVAEGRQLLAQQEQAMATLQNSIKDRDFRIESYEAEVRTLRASLGAAENAASETLELSEKRHAVVAAEVGDAQQHVAGLRRESEDMQAQLQQREQWMAKLKETLSEREARLKEQQLRADQLIEQLDAANQQLRGMDDTRQMLETQKHEMERELVSHQTKTKQAEAALEEQLQSINVFKSMIADRDFKIESLESDLVAINQAQESVQASGSPS